MKFMSLVVQNLLEKFSNLQSLMPLGTMLKDILYAYQVFEFPQDSLRNQVVDNHEKLDKQTPSRIYYTITLRIQALLLVESHDLLEERRTELRHTKPYPIAFPYLSRSCTHHICKISTFSNFKMFGWIKSKLFTCLIRGFSFYYMAVVSHFFVLPTL